MHLILDGPSPFDTPANLQEWLKELGRMAIEYAAHPHALDAIRFEKQRTKRDLRWQLRNPTFFVEQAKPAQ